MIIDSTFGLKGRYKAVVMGPDMEVRRETGWFDNVVTNLGVRMLLGGATVSPSATSVSIACSCGSGNTTPSIDDTQIKSFIAGTKTSISNNTTRNSTSPPYYVMHRWVFRFAAGVAQGNVAELCIVNSSDVPTSSSPVFSRALVRDSGGNPTAISVGPDEYLDVTYELYLYPSSSDQSGTFSQAIDGVSTSFSYISRACAIQTGGAAGSSFGWANSGSQSVATIYGIATSGGTYSLVYPNGGDLGEVGSTPTGASSTGNYFTSSSSATGVYSSKYRDITYTMALGNGNTSFDCFKLGYNLGCMQMKISPSVTKTSNKIYTITIRVTLDNTI